LTNLDASGTRLKLVGKSVGFSDNNVTVEAKQAYDGFLPRSPASSSAWTISMATASVNNFL
jgi:hypothetical protein